MCFHRDSYIAASEPQWIPHDAAHWAPDPHVPPIDGSRRDQTTYATSTNSTPACDQHVAPRRASN